MNLRTADAPGKRAYESLVAAFQDHDLMIRVTGDTIALTPPLIISEAQIDEIFDKLRRIIAAVH